MSKINKEILSKLEYLERFRVNIEINLLNEMAMNEYTDTFSGQMYQMRLYQMVREREEELESLDVVFFTDKYIQSIRNAAKIGFVSGACNGNANFHEDAEIFAEQYVDNIT